MVLSRVSLRWLFNSGVARVLRAPVQRHVMGSVVTKQLSNSFVAIGPAGQWLVVNSRKGDQIHENYGCVGGLAWTDRQKLLTSLQSTKYRKYASDLAY